MAAVLYGAFNLKKLFSLYKKGVVFSEQNVNCLRHIGYALISWVIANFTYVFLISVVVKYAVTSGSSQLVIRIGSSDIAILIIGAVIVLFSRVMKEAVILEDEHAHTV